MKILLLDIETAPHKVYCWGLFGQDIDITQIEEPGYTLSWAAKWYGEKDVLFNSIYHHGKRAMLMNVHSLIDLADVVVHYNGNKFDMPTLSQEFLAADFSPPSPVQNIDLYMTAKKRFRLPSNRLNYVAKYLGLGQKVQHKGMELWKGCMEGNANDWKVMEAYNKGDVTLLEKVYDRLKPWVPNHPNHGLYSDGNEPKCPSCGSTKVKRRGLYYTSTLTYQRYRCSNCGAWGRGRTTTLPKAKRAVILKGVN